jgi:hypothetical protein
VETLWRGFGADFVERTIDGDCGEGEVRGHGDFLILLVMSSSLPESSQARVQKLQGDLDALQRNLDAATSAGQWECCAEFAREKNLIRQEIAALYERQAKPGNLSPYFFIPCIYFDIFCYSGAFLFLIFLLKLYIDTLV